MKDSINKFKFSNKIYDLEEVADIFYEHSNNCENVYPDLKKVIEPFIIKVQKIWKKSMPDELEDYIINVDAKDIYFRFQQNNNENVRDDESDSEDEIYDEL